MRLFSHFCLKKRMEYALSTLYAQTKTRCIQTMQRVYVLVGTAGFELATPCTPCKCATRLRYAPKLCSLTRALARGTLMT
jgi:hypothetical protein